MSEHPGHDDGGMPATGSTAGTDPADLPGFPSDPEDDAAGEQRSLLENEPIRWAPPPEDTGDAGVDEILAGLPELQRQPVAEHIVGYTDVHDGLLGQLDSGVGGAGVDGD